MRIEDGPEGRQGRETDVVEVGATIVLATASPWRHLAGACEPAPRVPGLPSDADDAGRRAPVGPTRSPWGRFLL